MEHRRWKGRWQALEWPLGGALVQALEAMEDRWKGDGRLSGRSLDVLPAL